MTKKEQCKKQVEHKKVQAIEAKEKEVIDYNEQLKIANATRAKLERQANKRVGCKKKVLLENKQDDECAKKLEVANATRAKLERQAKQSKADKADYDKQMKVAQKTRAKLTSQAKKKK